MSRLLTTLVLLSFLAGTLLTSWGLVHLPWPHALPWADAASLQRFLMFLFVSMLLISLGALWSKKNPLFIGGILAFCIALLTGHIWPVMVVLWFMLASYSLGNIFLGWILSGVEDSWLMSCLVGTGLYGTVIGLLAHFPVNYVGVYSVLLVLPLIINWRKLAIKIKGLFSIVFANNPRSGIKSVSIKLDIVIAAIGLIYFVVALMPELGYDALAIHLFVPAQLKLRHEWGFDASLYVFSVMPMLGEWIYSIVYMLAGESASRLVDISYIFMLCGLVRELVLWAEGDKVGVRWSILIFLSTPLVFAEGSTLDIESIWSAFIVAGVLAILKVCSSSAKAGETLLTAGLLLGGALAAKAVSMPIIGILFVFLVYYYKVWYKRISLRYIAFGIGVFLVLGLIPYITSWLLTKNPVFPFYNAVFHSSYFPSNRNFDLSELGYHWGSTWDLLYKITFDTGNYLEASSGGSGFQWLLLFIPTVLLIIINKSRRRFQLLLMGVLIIIVVFHFISYLRYVFPAWVILSAAVGITSEVKFIKYILPTVLIGVVTLNLFFLTSANPGGIYTDFPLSSIESPSDNHTYLEKRMPMRNAIQLVNLLNINQKPVAIFGQPAGAGLSANVLYPNWYNVGFLRDVYSIPLGQDIINILMHPNQYNVLLKRSLRTKQDFVNALLKHGVGYIVLEQAGDVAGQQLIEQVTDEIASYGSISVRKIQEKYLYNKEILLNPDFKSIKGWDFSGEIKRDIKNHALLASVRNFAYQAVTVVPGKDYLNTVVARCEKALTLGRLQVNWNGPKGIVGTSIEEYQCAPKWTKYSMKVTAPLNATTAVVYVSGASAIPLSFKSNSFRG